MVGARSEVSRAVEQVQIVQSELMIMNASRPGGGGGGDAHSHTTLARVLYLLYLCDPLLAYIS